MGDKTNAADYETDVMDDTAGYKMEELLAIVSELAQKYTGGESTSVTYEKAQMLMGAVLYCLNEYRGSCADGSRRNICRNISVKEQYQAGAKLVFEKVQDIRKIFNELSLTFEDFGVKCLYDTVQKGIPHFLKWYDIEFCPQDTIVDLEYPVPADYSRLTGADAVYQYIRAVQIEQRVLNALDKDYVIHVLEKNNPEYQDMIENICSIVQMDAASHKKKEGGFYGCYYGS